MRNSSCRPGCGGRISAWLARRVGFQLLPLLEVLAVLLPALAKLLLFVLVHRLESEPTVFFPGQFVERCGYRVASSRLDASPRLASSFCAAQVCGGRASRCRGNCGSSSRCGAPSRGPLDAANAGWHRSDRSRGGWIGTKTRVKTLHRRSWNRSSHQSSSGRSLAAKRDG